MLKKIYPLLIFAGTFLLVLLLCVQGVLQAPRLSSGQRMGERSLSRHSYPLDHEQEIRLSIDADVSTVVLIRQGGGVDCVKRNGTPLDFVPISSMTRSLCACKCVPADAEKGQEWTLTLSLDNQYTNGKNHLFLCSENTLKWITVGMNIFSPLISGVLLTAAFYGAFMYIFKRMKMLIVFTLYSLCVFIWSFLTNLSVMLSLSGPVITCLADVSFDSAVVLSAVTSICFCRIPLPGKWKLLGKWYTIAGMCLLNTLLSSILPADALSVWRFIVYMIGVIVMILFFMRTQEKPWVVLIGLAITQALRFTNLWSPALPLVFLRSMKMFTMPYVLSCMIYISSVYGKKFKESEVLCQQLEVNNQLLDQKVAERTMELQKQQQFRTNLLTNIFHDLRSPLMVMRGCVDKLQRGEQSDQDLEVLDERLGFITNLTEDLFGVVKLEDPNLIMSTDTVEMDHLVKELVDGLRVSARQKGLDIECAAESGVIAWGDEIWLRRALQNLIENAVYYSPTGGKNVQVSMRTKENQILITVQDFGVGIAPEDQKLIFERYYQVSSTRKHHSSGLGLSIAMNVVRHHQGTLTVKSAVGEGTIFLMTLPLWEKRSEE